MRRAVVAAVVSTLLLIGSAPTGSAGAQAPGCLPTSARTIGPYAFPGLAVKQNFAFTDAVQYSQSFLSPEQAQGEADILNSLGFVSATWQYYGWAKRKAKGDFANADTEQLGSPEQAQAEFDRLWADQPGLGHAKLLTVAAVPGSRGWREPPTRKRHSSAAALWFTDGNYFYAAFRYVKRGGNVTSQVIHAAADLYNRVHGAPVCP